MSDDGASIACSTKSYKRQLAAAVQLVALDELPLPAKFAEPPEPIGMREIVRRASADASALPSRGPSVYAESSAPPSIPSRARAARRVAQSALRGCVARAVRRTAYSEWFRRLLLQRSQLLRVRATAAVAAASMCSMVDLAIIRPESTRYR